MNTMRMTGQFSELTPDALFPDLPVQKFCFHLQAEGAIPPWVYLGSAWRGVVGWELQKLICPFENHRCQTCSIQSSCPYFGLFERQSSLPGIQDAPRGYIIYPERQGRSGDFCLWVTLLGQCSSYAPVILESLFKTARRGMGREQIRFAVSSVEEINPHAPGEGGTILSSRQTHGPWPFKEWCRPVPDTDPEFCVHLLTPLRLRRQGRYLSRLDWPFVFQSLARRLEGLDCIFAQGRPLGAETWKTLVDRFFRLSPTPVDQTGNAGDHSGPDWLQWRDLKRFSNRQKKKVPMGGLVGTVQISDVHPWIASWLQAAELVHVGKGAAMGLGRLQLERRPDA